MFQSRTLAAAGAVALLSAVLVGCGGGEDTLTAKEFRSQANKLCKDADADTEKFGEDISEKSSDKEVTDAVDQTVERNNELVDDIDDLNAPDDLADDVDSMLDSVRDALKELDKISSVQELVAAASGEDPFAEVNRKATALKLDECAD